MENDGIHYNRQNQTANRQDTANFCVIQEAVAGLQGHGYRRCGSRIHEGKIQAPYDSHDHRLCLKAQRRAHGNDDRSQEGHRCCRGHEIAQDDRQDGKYDQKLHHGDIIAHQADNLVRNEIRPKPIQSSNQASEIPALS